MTSTVTNYSSNINVAFPITGVVNSSQGFRDNFSNISNAFTVASSEISDLQLNVDSLLNTPYLGNSLTSFTVNGTVTATNFVGTLTGDLIAVNVTANSGTIQTFASNLVSVNTVTITGGTSNANVSMTGRTLVASGFDSIVLTNLTSQNTGTVAVFANAVPTNNRGTVGDVRGMMYATSQTIYICYANYVDGSTPIWTKVASSSTW
jgi:hypothetical protein